MAWIRVISPKEASGETAEVYRYMYSVAGDKLVARIVQMFSLKPGSMRRMIRNWDLTMWRGDVPRHQRELLASLVSRLNDCAY
ncbi:MAG: hypothetical protein ACI8TX_001250 [Hyphomicrobiaceae bacterium]|jgi:hypothetical protein